MTGLVLVAVALVTAVWLVRETKIYKPFAWAWRVRRARRRRKGHVH